MKFSNFRICFLILAVATLFFAAAKPARADAYQILISAQVIIDVTGIEASGAVVFYTMAGSCGGGIPCWGDVCRRDRDRLLDDQPESCL